RGLPPAGGVGRLQRRVPHPLPAGAHLGLGEAQGRHHRRPLVVPCHGPPLDRVAPGSHPGGGAPSVVEPPVRHPSAAGRADPGPQGAVETMATSRRRGAMTMAVVLLMVLAACGGGKKAANGRATATVPATTTSTTLPPQAPLTGLPQPDP